MYEMKTKQKSLDAEQLSENQQNLHAKSKRKLKCIACTPQKQEPIKVFEFFLVQNFH